ncbi:MAG: 50S ribosomal protein L11 [Candidatus Pacearchaeota archaeon]
MKINLLVDGGAMVPGPTIAQKLGPLGIDINKIISEVNKATSSFKGIKVPVEIDVNPANKSFTITVSTPAVASLLKKELGIEKASGDHKNLCVGNIAIEQVIAIAKLKYPQMLDKDFKSAVKSVVGTCVSLGIMIENKPAKQVAKEISQGVYDKEILSERTTVSEEKSRMLNKYFSELKSKQEMKIKKAEEEKASAEATKTAESAAAGKIAKDKETSKSSDKSTTQKAEKSSAKAPTSKKETKKK